MNRFLLSALFGFINLYSCSAPTELDQSSELHYIGMYDPNSSSMRHAREPTFNVCIKGAVSASNVQKFRDYTKRSVLTWMKAVRSIDDKVTDKVEFSCERSHLTINYRQGNGTATAGPKMMNMLTERPYGTYLHELGHAFASLHDTYTNGSAGSCKSGQPKSVMCWGAMNPKKDEQGFSLLHPDDLAGIQARYKTMYSDVSGTPLPVNFDPLGGVNMDDPFNLNGSGNNNGDIQKIQLAVGAAQNNQVRLAISTQYNLYQAYLCQGKMGAESCAGNPALQIPLTTDKRVGEKNIFYTQNLVDISRILGGPLTLVVGAVNSGVFTVSSQRTVQISQ